MSEQARRIRHKATLGGAQNLYYKEGLISEVLVYHDDEALYFEVRGKDSGIMRLTFGMLETLKEVAEEQEVLAAS